MVLRHWLLAFYLLLFIEEALTGPGTTADGANLSDHVSERNSSEMEGCSQFYVGPADKYRLWLRRVVPYALDAGYDRREQEIIFQAIEIIQSSTCLRFKKYEKETDHLVFRPIQGCSSEVGRMGGRQWVSLTSSCFHAGPGLVVHELMHALGFYHEHTRPDRDDFVRVIKENIKPEALPNFKKRPPKLVDQLGLDYELGSIMHYGSRDFSLDGSRLTLEPLDPGMAEQMGQRSGPTELDLLKINTLYRCETTSCALPPSPSHGNVEAHGDPSVGQELTYSCDDDFSLAGPTSRTCQMSGNWSGIDPFCTGPDRFVYCDFEDEGLCGFQSADFANPFRWKRWRSSTPTWDTGPNVDHTTSTSSGYYLYAEASRRRPGETARTVSPSFVPPGEEFRTCLSLSYILWGEDQGTLRIILVKEDGQEAEVWKAEGNNGPVWLTVQVALDLRNPIQVMLEATVGKGPLSDIAVDDLLLVPCPEDHSFQEVDSPF